MRKEIDIYDTPEEIKAKKKTMSPKAKKTLVYAFCTILGIVVAAALIIGFRAIFSGAPTPEKAVAEYEKAALLYDIDGMIEYSSDYNKTVLYGNRSTSDRLLKSYLKKGYEGRSAQYSESEIKFALVSSLEYEKDSRRYNEAMIKYDQKVENGSEDIAKIAIVKMKITKGDTDTTREYLAVKKGTRWYFAYAIG